MAAAPFGAKRWHLRETSPILRWGGVALALLLLNCAVTFHNVWPTPGIRWPGELSIEVAVLLVALAVSNARLGPTSPRILAFLSVLFVAFALGRYGEVTAPALYGREVNLFWDLRHVGSVAGMLTRVAPMWIVAAVAVAAVAVLVALYAGARWSLGRVDGALQAPSARLALGMVGALLVILYVAQFDRARRIPQFSIPVSHTYAVQSKRVFDTFSISRAARTLPPSPVFHSDLSALAGGDVLVIFMESYGRVTYDRPALMRALTPARERFVAAAESTGRGVVSAFVTSPTFGGSSWFAHSSLMSGIDVADPDRYALLLTQKRPTLVSFFSEHGYRTVANMPGLRQSWPEGAFYGFDRIYDADALDYRGPEIGWWRIPDQYSLAALDAREIQPQGRRPLFAMFPTVNTHMPFRPTPPLQASWARVLSATPFDAVEVQRAVTQAPAWTDMGESYAASLTYSFEMLSSYLRERADRGFVMILLGDHQPAANVSGEGASRDIPVHVISRRPEILDSLKRRGFVAGIEPLSQPAGRMNELGQVLLDSFDAQDEAGDASGSAAGR
jgi:phosphoglycerol transferase MdoB-like AlkP superfamily enzyme